MVSCESTVKTGTGCRSQNIDMTVQSPDNYLNLLKSALSLQHTEVELYSGRRRRRRRNLSKTLVKIRGLTDADSKFWDPHISGL